jgi:hypothetical protein
MNEGGLPKSIKFESHRNSLQSDLQHKVRDLQLQIIDMQGTQERRMAMLNEQVNAKIERALAGVE